MCYNVHGGLAR